MLIRFLIFLLIVASATFASVRCNADTLESAYSGCVGGPAEVDEQTVEHLEKCVQFRFPDAYVQGLTQSAFVPHVPYLLESLGNVRRAGLWCNGTWHPAVPVARWSWDLQVAANEHAQYLARIGGLTHVREDGRHSWEVGQSLGYAWCLENLAHAPEPLVIHAWTKSAAGHCEALVDPRVHVFGAARVDDYWVLMLCARDWPE